VHIEGGSDMDSFGGLHTHLTDEYFFSIETLKNVILFLLKNHSGNLNYHPL